MTGRKLFVLNSEWTRLRRTGLSELSRIPHDLNTRSKVSPWERAYLIAPDYASLHIDALSDQRDRILEIVEGRCFLQLDYRPPIRPEGEYARIDGDLSSDRRPWESFALKVVDQIARAHHRHPTDYVDVLAVDWPMGPALTALRAAWQGQRLAAKLRLCFTVDLLPHDSEAMGLWCEGLARADVVHVPTKYWRDHLVAKYPEVEQVRDKIRVLSFGTNINSCSLDDKREGKRWLQEHRGLKCDDNALLFVALNRWTASDQKCYSAVIALMQDLLAEGKWNIQFVIGPLGKVDLAQSREFLTQLQEVQSKYRDRVFIELPEDIEGCPWGRLLKAADAQLLPSREEPCGIAHAQGMGYGVLPVCSRLGAMAEEPLNENNSFRFDWAAGGPEASIAPFRASVLNAWEVFHNDRPRWDSMAADAEQAAKAYDWPTLAPRYLDLFS